MNEPVAWINLERWKDASSYLEDCVADMKLESAGIVIPLYTHPVKEQIIQECIDAIDDGDGQMSSMAEHNWRQVCVNELKAILKKAQKK